jgi:hypothetical protein
MSNISQVNNYTKVKQLTNKDARQFGPLVHDYEEFTSSASQTVLNLSKIVCNLSYKSSVQVYVDGKLLREGSGNDYQWTSVSGGMSSQITFEYALPADLNIIVIRIGATAQSLPNASSVQANVNSTRLEVDKKDNVNGIINGSFEYWQRGASFAAVASGTMLADRWRWRKGGAAVHTISRSTDVPTTSFGQFSLLASCTTADVSIAASDFSGLEYRMEGNFFRRFNNKNIVMKFWVKATKTGISCINFQNSSQARSLVKEYTINQSNTWEQKTIRFTHDSAGAWNYTSGIGIRFHFILAAGTDFQGAKDTWQSANIYATSSQVNHTDNTANIYQLADVHFCEDNFDQTKDPEFQLAGRDLTEELQLCQRYYYRVIAISAGSNWGVGFCDSATAASVLVPFPVNMRVPPAGAGFGQSGAAGDYSVLHAGTTITACSAVPTLVTSTQQSARIILTVAGGLTAGRGAIDRAVNTAAFYAFDVEL